MDEKLINTVACKDAADDIGLLAQALIDVIPRDKAKLKPFRVMAYIAGQAIADGDEYGRRVETKEIYLDLEGNKNREPSAWLSPIWNAIAGRHYDEIKKSLIEKCRERGYSSYPVIHKIVEGKAMVYYLAEKPLPDLENAEIDLDLGVKKDSIISPALRHEIVQYEQDLTLKLSWLGEKIFHNGLIMNKAKRRVWVGFIASTGLFYWLLICLLLILFSNSTAPISARDFMIAATFSFIIWQSYKEIDAISKVFTNRIMLAPSWTVQWREFGATIEVLKDADPDAEKSLHLARYSAKCPCGGLVLLDDGGKEFHGRIVCRCNESPQEHVFSFERISRSGKSLR